MAVKIDAAIANARWQSKFGRYGHSLVHQAHVKLRLANFVCGLLPDFVSGIARHRIYRLIGLNVAPGAMVMGNLSLQTGTDKLYEKLSIGSGVVIGDHVTINLDGIVRIEDNVTIGPHVLIYTASHQMGPGSRRCIGEVVARPVTLERGCWVGVGASILPGVTIGHGSVVAGGAVVFESVPPNSYVEGNPGRVVRTLPWGDR